MADHKSSTTSDDQPRDNKGRFAKKGTVGGGRKAKKDKVKRIERAEGYINLIEGIEQNADIARDNYRIGRNESWEGDKRGMTVRTKKFDRQGQASGDHMGEAARKRRGGLSMSGHPSENESHPTKGEAVKRAKKFGTKVVRVQQAMAHYAKPKRKPPAMTSKQTSRATQTMRRATAKRQAKK